VAGGIGISPFLAILSDIIHRIEEGKQCMPKNVLVLWSVKKSKELSLLSAVDAQTISSSVSDKLRLDIQAFVTQESQAPLVSTTQSIAQRISLYLFIHDLSNK
jgi:predicted ferric reductase